MKSRTLMIVVLTILSVIGIALLAAEALPSRDWCRALLSLGPELIGAVVIYALFEVFLGRRMKEEEEKARLIRQLGSKVNAVAMAAAEELRKLGWLTVEELHGAMLEGANLRGADLSGFHLNHAILVDADLRGTPLYGAILRDAWLCSAKMQKAWLEAADLRNAKLWGTQLQGAKLGWACLEGAEIVHPGGDACFDEETILPNSVYWTPDTDMARFTDPQHPDFWRSGDPHSPAYRGDEG